jgi:glycosyltransferase involved in cell wall biosynthesis
MRQPLTIAILTKNEELLIERAIRSCAWADEVLVLDSGSTDRTCEIATRAGARVEQQPWLGWRGQHQRAVDLATNDWVMKIDADEIITAALARSIDAALSANPDPRDGFVLDRAEEFMGEFIPNPRRHSRRMTFVRVFNRLHSEWDPDVLIHERVKVAGNCHMLEGQLLHWRNPSFSRIVSTYNANADVEAKMLNQDHPGGPSALTIVFKPLLRFGWSYFLRGGWRGGMRGYLYAASRAMAEFMSLAKAWELQHAKPRLHPPAHETNYATNPSASGSPLPSSAPLP